MRPLRVTAHLGGVGVVGDGFFPLDSMLSWAVREEMGRPELDHAPAVDCLERRDYAGGWIYACSFADADWMGQGRSFWAKRPRFSEFRERSSAERIDIGAGRFKGYNMPVFYLLACEAHWYCVGDAERIRALLERVDAIGKKRTQGWGVVHGWTVEQWAHDWSEGRDGAVTRALPEPRAATLGLEGDPGYYGLRPAYWNPENQGAVVLPRVRVAE